MVRRFLLFVAFILLLFTALRIINPWLADSIVSFVRNFSFFSLPQAPGLSIQSFTWDQQTNDGMSGFVNDNILEWQIGLGQTSGSLDDLFTPPVSQTGIVSSWALSSPQVSWYSLSWWSLLLPPVSWAYMTPNNGSGDALLLRRIDALEQEIDRLQRENADLRARLSSPSFLQQIKSSTWSRPTREASIPQSSDDNESLYFFYETIR